MYKKGCADHNNTGIMAGMRPCGFIVLLSELFISESLPHSSLHHFYASNPAAASKISKN